MPPKTRAATHLLSPSHSRSSASLFFPLRCTPINYNTFLAQPSTPTSLRCLQSILDKWPQLLDILKPSPPFPATRRRLYKTDAATWRAFLLRSDASVVVQQALPPNAGDFLTSTSSSNAELPLATLHAGGLPVLSSGERKSNIASVGTTTSAHA